MCERFDSVAPVLRYEGLHPIAIIAIEYRLLGTLNDKSIESNNLITIGPAAAKAKICKGKISFSSFKRKIRHDPKREIGCKWNDTVQNS